MNQRPEIYRVSGTVASTLSVNVNWELPSGYIAIRYYDADPALGGANEVTPGAGTAVVQAEMVVHDRLVDITDGTFDCTITNSYASFVGNVNRVQVVPTGITTATHYELLVAQNYSI